MKNLVSVIIPTYERYDLVLRAIDSVYNQTYPNIEIIVVNDNSKDERYFSLNDDSRIKYIKSNKRLGYPGKVRNLGIKESSGEWLAFLDDDDFWLKDKLEKQMLCSDKYDFICCDALINNVRYNKNFYIDYWNNNNPENKDELDYSILLKHNLIINSTVVIKKDLINGVGGFDETRRQGEDYITWLKITKMGAPCFFLDESLMEYNMNTQKHYTDIL
jgi:glycosyltransferase involved in cell wall biosynthesis